MSKPQRHTDSRLARAKQKMFLQFGGILLLSLVVGFAFNASHPLGVSFEQTVSRDEIPSVARPRITPAVTQPEADQSTAPAAEPSAPPPLPVPPAAPAIARATSWDQVKPQWLRGQVLLVDARTKSYYDNGHIPGAVYLPSNCTPEQYSAFKEEYDFNTPISVYCSSESCSLSKQLAERLVVSGYKSVTYMTGGYQEFQKREVVVAGDLPLRTPDKNPAPITWKEAKPSWLRGRALFLDARSVNAYAAGHIPGAISLPQGDPPETVAAFREKTDLKTPLVIYCSDANCSLSDKLAEQLVRMGYQSVRYMPGGFVEFQRSEFVPVRTGSAR